MFDAHAHIGELCDDAFVCTESTDLIGKARSYRYWALGTIPEGKEHDISKLYDAAISGGHIGEIGLDRIAVIHSVRTYGAVYGILSDMRIERFIIHGYTGSVEMARSFIKLGGIISLPPRIAYARSFPAILSLPFVTETDMKTGEDERKALSVWNEKLSVMTGRDIGKESERKMLEVLG